MMKQVCLLLTTIIFLAQPVHALFRFHKKQEVFHHAAPQQVQDYHNIAVGLPYQHSDPRRLRRTRMNPDDRYNITTPGIFSLVCATLSLVFLAAVSITAFSLLSIPVFIFAVLAAVFGAVGVRRHKPGYAIAGLILGILGMVGGFVTLVVL